MLITVETHDSKTSSKELDITVETDIYNDVFRAIHEDPDLPSPVMGRFSIRKNDGDEPTWVKCDGSGFTISGPELSD